MTMGASKPHRMGGPGSGPSKHREPYLFTARWIFRRDEIQHIYRLLRVCWCRGAPGTGYGYSAKFTVALSARFYEWRRDTQRDVELTVFWLRFHYSRSYGGRFAP